MIDIINFVMDHTNEIANYEILFYSDGDKEVVFTMKNGDEYSFFAC